MRKQLEQQVVTGKSVKVKEEVHEVCDIEHKSVIDTDTKLCNINSEDLQLICESNEEAQIETTVEPTSVDRADSPLNHVLMVML
ncbi:MULTISPECIES: hypothetical protein [unclassified Wolbachia]|uniref:hypothetical protein n=1 Tax=unclassified Wolbachia TaxID=2640676 RepID=UPI0031331EEC